MSAHLIATDLAPVGGFYAIFMGLLAVGLRLQRRSAARADDGRPSPGRVAGRVARRFPAGWRALGAQVIATAAGGYLLLMAVLTGFYYGVSKVGSHFLASAFTGCAMLVAIALPVFGVASWLARRRRRPAPAAVLRQEGR